MSFKNQKKNASPTATRHPFPVDILFRFPFILSMCSVLTLAMAESVLFRPLINVTFPAAKICPSDTDNALGAAGGRENQTTFGRYHRASLKRRKRVRAREREREREREEEKGAQVVLDPVSVSIKIHYFSSAARVLLVYLPFYYFLSCRGKDAFI